MTGHSSDEFEPRQLRQPQLAWRNCTCSAKCVYVLSKAEMKSHDAACMICQKHLEFIMLSVTNLISVFTHSKPFSCTPLGTLLRIQETILEYEES